MGMKIAIVGSGISGLGAAWALHEDHEVVVFEADSRIGGHSNTVDVATERGVTRVDTGFIVYNEHTYPHLTRLFDRLRVPTEASDMSFSFSLDLRLEYGASATGVLAQPSNLLRPGFLSMLRDINRFRRIGTELEPHEGESIGDLMRRNGFSESFLKDYLFPMTGAIWSSGNNEIARYPAKPILDFLTNHGLIEIVNRPLWRTVSGGSRAYVDRLIEPFRGSVRVDSPVSAVHRDEYSVTVSTRSGSEEFDHVIFATHSDQALRILGVEATDAERDSLRAIPYQKNVAVLHSDERLMPANRRVWASWNAMARSDERRPIASVTYWMNRLQNLSKATPLFVSLNPLTEPDPSKVHGRYSYAHPFFGEGAVEAQHRISQIQGLNRTWFAGAYLGYGFHEDGLQSGLNVAAALGSPVPWQGSIKPMSSAPMPVNGLAVPVH